MLILLFCVLLVMHLNYPSSEGAEVGRKINVF